MEDCLSNVNILDFLLLLLSKNDRNMLLLLSKNDRNMLVLIKESYDNIIVHYHLFLV